MVVMCCDMLGFGWVWMGLEWFGNVWKVFGCIVFDCQEFYSILWYPVMVGQCWTFGMGNLRLSPICDFIVGKFKLESHHQCSPHWFAMVCQIKYPSWLSLIGGAQRDPADIFQGSNCINCVNIVSCRSPPMSASVFYLLMLYVFVCGLRDLWAAMKFIGAFRANPSPEPTATTKSSTKKIFCQAQAHSADIRVEDLQVVYRAHKACQRIQTER